MSTNANEIGTTPVLLQDTCDGVITLTLNRPKQYNALSADLMSELQLAFDTISKDDTARVVVIAANGKAFCAGHDLKEMRSSEERTFHQSLFDQCGRLMLSINQLPQPVIAQVDGIATAAGCQLVANCDLAVATDTSRFAVSGINLGLFCSTPAVPLSRNLLRKKALQLLLTGDFVDAQRAEQLGLVNEVVPASELESTTRSIALKIAAKSSLSIQLGKEMFYQQLNMNLEDAYRFASERMACNMDSHDAREGIDAFFQKRVPKWTGK